MVLCPGRPSSTGPWSGKPREDSVKFRAAVLASPGARMTIETVETRTLAPGEVLVRTGAAGLCHTDLEVIDGQLRYPAPIVLGHEAAGTIEEVGPGVDAARCGQRVVLSWNPHCGQCFQCNAGQPILCERYVRLAPLAVGFDGLPKLWRGDTALHSMFYLGAFAEYVIVTTDCAVPIPAEMPLDRACLLGCGVLTGVGAFTRVARLRYGDTAMVIGCGAVGLSAVQGARLAGAGEVVAVDVNKDKLALASSMGATHAVEVGEDDPVDAVRELTEGRGADCVVESAGNESAFRMSVESCRVGGQVVWLGKVGLNDEVAFRWGSLMGEKRIIRSSYGGALAAQDFPLLARSYLEGHLDLDPLLTNRISLEEVNDGFEELRSGRAIRSVIVFDR
jgi:S-(hydroxymethyl)glutathione dehydrogenase / alcohol dehydrogenase